ncbi:SMI1/KNR4 family protein [Xanthomonas sp. AmX2]|uniref:SMI1/KNR4 family protein n=1 Tax=Xanthomonas sp. TaxID=29446 RepID=UPI00197F3E33|nr:SMI1/KNR4 family protein [Xanthomonas sp.]MBN6148927.1 SMI1/KNR4 family protein [Xanthomonas sp.]
MAADWTTESFQAHITAVFDDAQAKAKAATTTSEIESLRDRLSEEWYGAKPGAFLPGEVFGRLNARLGQVGDVLAERFVALKEPGVAIAAEDRIAIERDGPTLANFFYAPHYSNSGQPSDPERREAAIRSAEARLGLALPQPLRDLYARQNGGHTDFFLASRDSDPPYEFVGTQGAVIRQAYDVWMDVLPGMDIVPLENLETLGHFSDATDFGDDDESWRNYLPEIDRFVSISNHGFDIWLCLDYRDGRQEPKVVLFDDTQGDRSGKNVFEYAAADFASFFAGLRRHAIDARSGRRMRGVRALEENE